MNDWINRWRQKFERFMIGRYGVDPLARFLNICMIVLLIANFLFRSHLLYWLALLILFCSYFRMFSKNIPARFQENERSLRLRFKAGECLKRSRFQGEQALKYHIYRCPGCGQKIRIPRGRGKVSIRCPKCHNEFIRRS